MLFVVYTVLTGLLMNIDQFGDPFDERDMERPI